MQELNNIFRTEENVALFAGTFPDHLHIEILSYKKLFFLPSLSQKRHLLPSQLINA